MATPPRRHVNSGTANFAGATSGTGLLGLANAVIPDNYHATKALAIYAAPSIGIFISYVWTVVSYRLYRRANLKDMDEAVKEARKFRDEAASNPNASQKHRDEMQSLVEKLEKTKMEMLRDGAIAVTARLRDTTV